MSILMQAWAPHECTEAEVRLADIRLNLAWCRRGWDVSPWPRVWPAAPWSFDVPPGEYNHQWHGRVEGPGLSVSVHRRLWCVTSFHASWRGTFLSSASRLVVIEQCRRVLFALGARRAIWLPDSELAPTLSTYDESIEDLEALTREAWGNPQPSLIVIDPGLGALAEEGQVTAWFATSIDDGPYLADADLVAAVRQLRIEHANAIGAHRTSSPRIAPQPTVASLSTALLVDLAMTEREELVARRSREEVLDGVNGRARVVVTTHPDEHGSVRVELAVTEGADVLHRTFGGRRRFLRLADGRISASPEDQPARPGRS